VAIEGLTPSRKILSHHRIPHCAAAWTDPGLKTLENLKYAVNRPVCARTLRVFFICIASTSIFIELTAVRVIMKIVSADCAMQRRAYTFP